MSRRLVQFFCFLAMILCSSVVFAEHFGIITFHKGGTHVLIKLLQEPLFHHLQPTSDSRLASHKGYYMSTHFYSEDQTKFLLDRPHYKIIICTRDLRDVALSMVDWFSENNTTPFCNRGPNDPTRWFHLSYHQKIEALFQPHIWGQSRLLAEARAFKKLLQQIKNHQIFFTSYEKLVGPLGGGSAELQQQELHRIAKFLNIKLSKSQVKQLAKRLYGDTHTFRHGKIGRWQEHFDIPLQQLAISQIGDVMNVHYALHKHK